MDRRLLGDVSFINRIEEEKRGREKVVLDIPMEVITKEVSRVCGIASDQFCSISFERKGLMAGGCQPTWQGLWRTKS